MPYSVKVIGHFCCTFIKQKKTGCQILEYWIIKPYYQYIVVKGLKLRKNILNLKHFRNM